MAGQVQLQKDAADAILQGIARCAEKSSSGPNLEALAHALAMVCEAKHPQGS